jgi:hypothetical protein
MSAWITRLELLRRKCTEAGVDIDNTCMVLTILSNAMKCPLFTQLDHENYDDLTPKSLGDVKAYWLKKYKLLYRVKRPDEMSELLHLFFANLVPMIALLWALSMALFYNKGLKTYLEDDPNNDRLIPVWITLGFAFLFNLVPIRTMINKSFETT